MKPWLAWNSLCKPGFPGTQQDPPLLPPNVGTEGLYQLFFFSLEIGLHVAQPSLEYIM